MLTHATKRSGERHRTREGADEGSEARSGTRVELWCEPTRTCGGSEFDLVAEWLRRLDECGAVDAAVETWDRFVDVSGGYPSDEASRETRDRLGELDRWAWQRGRDVLLPAERRLVGRGRLGPATEMRRVPRAALVEFENGVVTNVTVADERVGCLTDRLETIAERELEASSLEEVSATGDSPERLRY